MFSPATLAGSRVAEACAVVSFRVSARSNGVAQFQEGPETSGKSHLSRSLLIVLFSRFSCSNNVDNLRDAFQQHAVCFSVSCFQTKPHKNVFQFRTDLLQDKSLRVDSVSVFEGFI